MGGRINPRARLLLLSAMTGLVGGLAAALMEWGIYAGSRALIGQVAPLATLDLLEFHVGVLLFPALGGLVSGLVVLLLCRRSGQGIETLIRAFQRDQGDLPLQTPTVRAAASVGVISSGGSAGPEAPIAALGAALGSSIGGWASVTPRDRRILLLAGCAAGIGAIFRAPLGGALFAVGVLYSEPDYETEAIVPSLVASVAGYSTFMALWGHGEPLLPNTEVLRFSTPIQLVPFIALGLLCGLASIFFAVSYSAVERLTHRLHFLPAWLAPAVGGVATGALACAVPQVIDGRYDFVRMAMAPEVFALHPAWYWVVLMAAVLAAKCVATSFTVGSGGSGGLLGPSLFIGGVAGALVGAAFLVVLPQSFSEPLRESLIPVGMAGVLAATMRTPLAAIVMGVEMTGSYGLIVPSMLVCAISYLIGRRWGMYPHQVPTAAQSPVHGVDAIVQLLEATRVEDLADRQWPQVVGPGATLTETIRQLTPGTHVTVAVVEAGRFLGLITLPDLHRVIVDETLARMVIALDLMTSQGPVLNPDVDLYSALEVFRRVELDAIPVVSRGAARRWIGMLTRRQIYELVQKQIAAARELALREHAGLLAIDQEARLEELLATFTSGQGVRLERLMVPVDAVGKSLRQSGLNSRYHAEVIAVEEPDGSLQCPPDRDRPLQSGQRLLAFVRRPETSPPSSPPGNNDQRESSDREPTPGAPSDRHRDL